MSQFQPGQSGNPSGRPKGISDKRHRLRQELESYSSQLIAHAVQRALTGSDTVLIALINRLVPNLRPELDTGDDVGGTVEVRWMR